MNSSSKYNLKSVASYTKSAIHMIFTAATLASVCFAEDFKGQLSPNVEFFSSSKSNVLKAGFQYMPGKGIKEIPPKSSNEKQNNPQVLWSLYAKVPTSKDNDTLSDISNDISYWRIGGGGDFSIANTNGKSSYTEYRMSFSLNGGFNKFSYNPEGNSNKDELTKGSFSADVTFFYFHAFERKETKKWIQLCPQVNVTFNRDYKESDKVGVVSIDPDTNIEITKDMVIKPPSANPEMQVRFAIPIQLPNELGLGPSIAYKAFGEKDAYKPTGKAARVVSQFFLYYSPSDFKGGGRIGLAPYIDSRVSGEDKKDKTDYGVLLDLRMGVNIWNY